MTGGAFVALAVSTLLCSSPLCNRIGAAVVVIVAVRAFTLSSLHENQRKGCWGKRDDEVISGAPGTLGEALGSLPV